MFMMSIFEISTGVLKKLDHSISRFYWQGDTNKKKVSPHKMRHHLPTKRLTWVGYH
jgi:hypothetical protein